MALLRNQEFVSGFFNRVERKHKPRIYLQKEGIASNGLFWEQEAF